MLTSHAGGGSMATTATARGEISQILEQLDGALQENETLVEALGSRLVDVTGPSAPKSGAAGVLGEGSPERLTALGQHLMRCCRQISEASDRLRDLIRRIEL